MSTAGRDGLIAAEFTDPAAPRALWAAALGELGSIDVLSTMPGCSRRSPTMRRLHMARRVGRTLTINLQASADLCRLALAHFAPAARPHRQRRQPRAAYRGDSPAALALCARKAG